MRGIRIIWWVWLWACVAHGASMQFGNTNVANNGIEFSSSTDYVLIPFRITNNDLNAEYSEAVLYSTKGLASDPKSGMAALYNFGGNSTTYSNLEHMITAQTGGHVNMYVTLDQGSGYVNSGWEIGWNADGSIRIFCEGGKGADDWVDDRFDNSTAQGYVVIGSWLFDGDGVLTNFTLDPELVAPGDAIPVIDPDKLMSGARATTTLGGFRTASGHYLSIIQFQTTNGTSVSWMEEHGLSDDTTDPDSDGFQTLEEYICGTDPTNGAAFFQVGISSDGIQIPSVSNRLYTVEGRAALSVSNHWKNVTNNLPGSGNVLTVRFTTNRFYRVGVSFP